MYQHLTLMMVACKLLVCRAVKINSITVPERYEIKKDAEALILDCDYTKDANEVGFVLKVSKVKTKLCHTLISLIISYFFVTSSSGCLITNLFIFGYRQKKTQLHWYVIKDLI